MADIGHLLLSDNAFTAHRILFAALAYRFSTSEMLESATIHLHEATHELPVRGQASLLVWARVWARVWADSHTVESCPR